MRAAAGLLGAVLVLGACERPEVQAARRARATLTALGLPSDGASCGPLDGGVAACEVWLVDHAVARLDCSPVECRVRDDELLPEAFRGGGWAGRMRDR